MGHRGSCCDLCQRVFCLCSPLGVLRFLVLHLDLSDPGIEPLHTDTLPFKPPGRTKNINLTDQYQDIVNKMTGYKKNYFRCQKSLLLLQKEQVTHKGNKISLSSGFSIATLYARRY